MKLISQKQALNIMLGLLSGVMVFHILVLTEVIPYNIVWAGKLHSVQEMRVFESVSMTILVINILIFLLKAGYIKHKISEKILNWIIGFYALLFFVNTIGNLFAQTAFEKYFFTPLTLVSAILCVLILVGDKSKN
ncbi:MAG: hypothetical protein IPP61_15565 [Cytophagaceae bacterium]|nr:hypothetical protein [Cytophagaceae bacterium]MBK9932564.1 hypothetical protein [Cytophagaceae bacterium]MBL0303751.1 hypothetical protein [Cytophagaceae bacterium]MBL0326575.1 hypothetical protein [Cytophagaceae bacterium]